MSASASVRDLAVAAGCTPTPEQIVALSDALDDVQIGRDLRTAANRPSGPRIKAMSEVAQAAGRLAALLEPPAVGAELDGARPYDQPAISEIRASLAIVREAALARARSLDAVEPIDFGRPMDGVIKDLGRLATKHLNIAATTPGDPPGGPFVAFVQGVFRLWGETPPSPAGIKSALYR
jgi:hypothetical protein